MMYLLLTQVKNFIKIGFRWKTWAKPEYLASMSIWIDWGANMVMPDIHIWDIERVQYGNNKKGSCCMEKIVSRFKYFNTWWVRSHEDFDQSYCDMYKSRYVLCSKCYEHIVEWLIRWSLDDSKDILLIFGTTKNMLFI